MAKFQVSTDANVLGIFPGRPAQLGATHRGHLSSAHQPGRLCLNIFFGMGTWKEFVDRCLYILTFCCIFHGYFVWWSFYSPRWLTFLLGFHFFYLFLIIIGTLLSKLCGPSVTVTTIHRAVDCQSSAFSLSFSVWAYSPKLFKLGFFFVKLLRYCCYDVCEKRKTVKTQFFRLHTHN